MNIYNSNFSKFKITPMRINKPESFILSVALDISSQQIINIANNTKDAKIIASTLSKLQVLLLQSSKDNRSGRTSDDDFKSILLKYCKSSKISKMLNSVKPASDILPP